MTRFRDLGIVPGYLTTGERNAITDVDGVQVGHSTIIEGDNIRTGVTAILPHSGNIFQEKVPAAVYTINGFGKAISFEQVREFGTIETPILLTNTLNIGKVSDALVAYMLRQNPNIGLDTTGTVNPIVGECNDGYLNDIRGRHVNEKHVLEALETASSDSVQEGNVGAGTGTVCYGFKGGIGTASRRVGEFTVGALLQTNFGTKAELTMMGTPIGQHFIKSEQPPTGPGSVMMILATDAPMNSRQLTRLAKRASFGIARTGTVCHNGSGDFVIAFSTANRRSHNLDSPTQTQPFFTEDETLMNTFFQAVVEAVEESAYNALIAAETMNGRDGHALYALPHEKVVELLNYYRRLYD